MPQVLIDNREVTIPAGRRLNGIEAARLAGIEIPFYCWHPGLSVVGSCRMCLVEVGTRDPASGKITMQPKLSPACNVLVTDNMVLVTQSEKVARARAMVEEDLLLRHPIDCPICDKAGECLLQDYHFAYGQPERRADIQPFTSRRRDLGDVTLFVDRCVMCSRCIRFAAEISGTHELMVTGRAAHEEIDVMAGYPLNNKLSGNVVDLCPVGALCDKDFLYRQRVWFLRRHAGVCTGCSTGCSIWIEENQERIWRVKPRENPFVNTWWICNEGRYDYPHVHNPRRLRRLTGKPDQLSAARDTDAALAQRHPTAMEIEATGRPVADQALKSPPPSPPRPIEEKSLSQLAGALRGAGRLAAVVSPFLTVEESYLLCKLIRGIDPGALLVLGPVPTAGEDERFAKGFTVRAEKCPNRRGVEAVIAHFVHRVDTFDDLLPRLDRGEVQGVWVSGGYKRDWIDEATARRFERLKLLVVHDLFPSPLSERATYVLPGAAYAERDGSYVNRADRLQSVRRAIRPPVGVWPEGRVYWELLGRKGLYNSDAVLAEVAREISYFSAVVGPVPEVGIDLRANLLARAAERSATV
ncbi:MAG: 2Fe-2S iron-sulfur cluster-binding protein [Planctomycetaceae bacterium]|nr:2Fe-2S iron-sulfur cluster-binding protein [Planctomycetaceae bacterium]